MIAGALLLTGFGPASTGADLAPTAGDDAAAGKAAFTKARCNSCHGVKAAGIKPKNEPEPGEKAAPDLSELGKKKPNLEETKQFLRKKVKREGKKHPKKFKGTDAEADAILKWLVSLK